MRSKIRVLFAVVVCCLSAKVFCAVEMQGEFDAYRDQVAGELVPDGTLGILEAELVREGERWVLRGETTVEEAQRRIEGFADALVGEGGWDDEFLLLGAESVGADCYGIVKISTAHLRARPALSAEMVDQAILGRTVRLLKVEGGWSLVQTDYDYIGWMHSGSFYRTDDEGVHDWDQTKKVIVTSNAAVVYSEADSSSVPVTDVTLNALLRFHGADGGWTEVSTPDGRRGFIENGAVSQKRPVAQGGEELRKAVIRTARSMTGVSYLWGGNSTKANDCSGFVQTVFRANGIELPRDAHQQATRGIEVKYGPEFAELRAGDLLFFGHGERVTHVGISLGGARFIHQSDYVHVSSFDPNDGDFSGSLRKSLVTARRVIEEPAGH